jgi:hypothetical protein
MIRRTSLIVAAAGFAAVLSALPAGAQVVTAPSAPGSNIAKETVIAAPVAPSWDERITHALMFASMAADGVDDWQTARAFEHPQFHEANIVLRPLQGHDIAFPMAKMGMAAGSNYILWRYVVEPCHQAQRTGAGCHGWQRASTFISPAANIALKLWIGSRNARLVDARYPVRNP